MAHTRALPSLPLMSVNRRDALKGLGALLTAGCGQGAKTNADTQASSGEGDSAAEAPPDGFGWDLIRYHIDTVVVLMMENRSFDHMLGARSLVEGATDVDGLTEEMSNPHPDGSTVAVFPTGTFCLSDPPHSWSSSHRQFNDGANDGFVAEFEARATGVGQEAMGFWDRETLTATWALADDYVVCDRWYCSLMSSTWPNRYYASCGQNGGVQGNSFPTTTFPSIYSRIGLAGKTWGCYYSNVPFLIVLPDRTPQEEQFQPIETFFEHAAAGTLPNVTVVDPVFGRNDDHPPAHPVAGQVLISQVYEALRTSPQWNRILFVVTYDEHGGFFDHVPPPTLPDDRAAEGFDQAGFRVPTLVIGPWVKSGQTSHVVYDHTSILAFIEHLFDVPPLTTRDAAADPMLDVFDADRLLAGTPKEGRRLPVIEADEAELYAPECGYDASFFTERGGSVTLQPELEAFLDEKAGGSRVDRRAETDQIYEALLERAERDGLLRRGRLGRR